MRQVQDVMIDRAAALAGIMQELRVSPDRRPRPQLLGHQALEGRLRRNHAQELHRRQHLGGIAIRAIGIEMSGADG